MDWIKGSTRKPPPAAHGTVLSAKFRGNPFSIIYLTTEGGEWCWREHTMMRRYGAHKKIVERDWNFMEWLDETNPPSPPAPTIGARWVPGPPKLDDKIDSERVYVCKTGRDYSVWVVAHVQLGFYTYPALCDGKKVVDIENFYCDYHYMLSPPATFPTGWIPGTPKLEKPCVFASISGNDYSVWEVLYLDHGDGSYLAICNGDGEEWGDIADFHCDAYYMLSPCTFPTREQAQEWALETFIPHTEKRTAALAMYDWIVQQLNPHT